MTGAAPPAGSAAEQNRLAAIAAYAIIGAEADDPVRADLRALCELAATMCGAPSAVKRSASIADRTRQRSNRRSTAAMVRGKRRQRP